MNSPCLDCRFLGQSDDGRTICKAPLPGWVKGPIMIAHVHGMLADRLDPSTIEECAAKEAKDVR